MLELRLVIAVVVTIAYLVEIIHIELPNKGLISVMPEIQRQYIPLKPLDIFYNKSSTGTTPMNYLQVVGVLSYRKIGYVN